MKKTIALASALVMAMGISGAAVANDFNVDNYVITVKSWLGGPNTTKLTNVTDFTGFNEVDTAKFTAGVINWNEPKVLTLSKRSTKEVGGSFTIHLTTPLGEKYDTTCTITLQDPGDANHYVGYTHGESCNVAGGAGKGVALSVSSVRFDPDTKTSYATFEFAPHATE